MYASRPSQASSANTEPASKQVSATFPHGLASSTFFAIPKANIATPRANFSSVWVRPTICRATSA